MMGGLDKIIVGTSFVNPTNNVGPCLHFVRWRLLDCGEMRNILTI